MLLETGIPAGSEPIAKEIGVLSGILIAREPARFNAPAEL
jgi:hypothetical protein